MNYPSISSFPQGCLLSTKPGRDSTLGLCRSLFDLVIGLVDLVHRCLSCILAVLLEFALGFGKFRLSLVYLQNH